MSTHVDKTTCAMICPISAGMIGVCMTTIGLIRVAITINKIDTLADDLLALDAVVFLIAMMTSYLALRTTPARRLYWLEEVADKTFILGIIGMVAACIFVTYFIA